MPRNDARQPRALTIEQHLAEAEAMIHEARARMGKAIDALRAEQAGYPTGGDGGGSSSASGLDRFLDPEWDGTGQHAVRDPARDELAALTRNARTIHSSTTAVYDLAVRWSTPSRARPAADDGDRGCELAARVKRGRLRGLTAPDARRECELDPRPDDGRSVYEPTRVEATRGPRRPQHPAGPCDGATCEEPHYLPRAYRLGDWSYRFVMATGRIPSLEEMIAHLQGRTIRAGQRATPAKAAQRA